MERRDFLKTSAVLAAGVLASTGRTAFASAPASGSGWRVFDVTTRIEVREPSGATRAWLPLPSVRADDWSRPMGSLWRGHASRARVERDPEYGAEMLVAEWPAGVRPEIEVVNRVALRDRGVDLTRADVPARLAPEDRSLYTRATELLPTDGIVRKTALDITRGIETDRAKAEAIYQWVVANSVRNPKTRGCGLGDIRFMLETGDLSGKCADLNALYVGLARAVGLPARDVYGIRVADSRIGYRSLGKSGDISKAQHCRAEVWLDGYGWVPVDPADVRKVMLEEVPGGLGPDAPKVVAARDYLFGNWEMNWLAYNTAHDLTLPGSRDVTVPYLMYPQAETADGMRDSLDPAAFSYRIDATEITAPA